MNGGGTVSSCLDFNILVACFSTIYDLPTQFFGSHNIFKIFASVVMPPAMAKAVDTPSSSAASTAVAAVIVFFP